MSIDIRKIHRWKLTIVTYTNFRKEFPTMGKDCFKRWFYFDTWKLSGKIWSVGVRHYQISVDFSLCLANMEKEEASK